MSINFVTNDPKAPGAAPVVVTPTPDRAAALSSFDVYQLPAENVYPTDTTEFVAWQAREAALRTLNVFEGIAGPLPGWRGETTRRRISLYPNLGEELNAYYDRSSVSFYQYTTGAGVMFSGASTDVVSHEVGHAILDALRPDLWGVQTLEVTAFHEGFGDCIAIMTALSDDATRKALLATDQDLSNGNFVETVMEQLAEGIATVDPNHNAAAPRKALNAFKWAFPQALPEKGGPGALINELHSFGQLTSGCFYELIREIFVANGGGQQGLWDACEIAMKLLVLGVAEAPMQPRFLETVGRTMLLADRDKHGLPGGKGQNEDFIRAAFDRHGITLSVSAFLAPRSAIAAAPPAGAVDAKLTVKAKKELRSIMAPDEGAKLQTISFSLAGPNTSQVTSDHQVDLTGLSERLANVKCVAPQVAVVGPAGGATAVLGTVPSGATISNEVRSFVGTLVKHGLIDFGDKDAKRAKGRKLAAAKAARGAGAVSFGDSPTHALHKRGQSVFLERICFACGCVERRRPRCISV